MNYLLFNELADAGEGAANANRVAEELKGKGFEVGEMVSLIGLDTKEFFAKREEKDNVVIFGGDGTLNHFVNNIGDEKIRCPLYLYPTGTGNDFQRDLPEESKDQNLGIYRINSFVSNLPIVEVQGKKYRFVNGIGFGIDGECCVKAEEMKAAGEKNINYGNITIGLLMGPYVPPTATIVVDGKEPIVMKKAYLASAMNGRFYGGGMMIAPEQVRNSGKLTLACIHGRGKLGTLLLFPKLFKGTHVKKKKSVYLEQGKVIEVSFDRPCGLQIDGEVLTGVTSYKAYIQE